MSRNGPTDSLDKCVFCATVRVVGSGDLALKAVAAKLAVPSTTPAALAYDRACMRSRRRVARRTISEQTSTSVTRTSAPAHACRCQSSYGPVA